MAVAEGKVVVERIAVAVNTAVVCIAAEDIVVAESIAAEAENIAEVEAENILARVHAEPQCSFCKILTTWIMGDLWLNSSYAVLAVTLRREIVEFQV